MDSQHTVAVLLFDQVNAIDVAGPIEVFATARHESGSPAYAVETWTAGDKPVRSESGLQLCADKILPRRPTADTLLIPGGQGIRDPHVLAATADWLRRNHQGFGRIASICTGAYALAAAGLVDGRRVATHWAFATDLQARFPNVGVDADALFLRDGRFYSSGGVTAGIDLALDLVEADLGGQVAMRVARQMVVFLQRTGTQAQFSMPLKMQTVAPGRLASVCKWAANNLEQDLSVDALAEQAGISARQFSRRFTATFGKPPAAYIKRLRLDAGRNMLEQGISISNAAHAVGFASQDGFRRAFEGQFGISPGDYQKRFQQMRSLS